jgi:hypothetical protein
MSASLAKLRDSKKAINNKIQESHKELLERIAFFSLQQQKMSQVRNLVPTEKLGSSKKGATSNKIVPNRSSTTLTTLSLVVLKNRMRCQVSYLAPSLASLIYLIERNKGHHLTPKAA